MVIKLLSSNLGARSICAAVVYLLVVLFNTPSHASSHTGSPSEAWQAGPLCTTNVPEHLVLPLLILNRDSIITAAANLSLAQRWYYGVNKLATMPLPSASDPIVTDTTFMGHAKWHERLRPLGQLALASGWSLPEHGSSQRMLQAAYGQPLASPHYMALVLVLLLAFVVLGKWFVPAQRRRSRQPRHPLTA